MCSLSGPQIMHRIFVEVLFFKPSKNSVSLTIFLSCNFKGLISVGWRRIVVRLIYISASLYFGRNASLLIARLCGYVINTVGLEDIACR